MKKQTKLLTIASMFCLGVVGCGSGGVDSPEAGPEAPSYTLKTATKCTYETFYVTLNAESRWSPKAQDALYWAIERWNDVQDKVVIRFPEEAQEGHQIEVKLVDEIPIFEERMGQADYLEDRCFIQLEYNVEAREFTYLHELGHCLGLGHSDEPDSVMFPAANNGGITELVLDTLSAIPVCEVKNENN